MSAPTLQVAPTQWADFKDLEDVAPIDDSDLACLAEVRAVLNRHGKRDRFGVALLHKHFDMDDGEVLLENTNQKERTLTLRPADKAAAEGAVPTVWKLLDGQNESLVFCKQCIEGSAQPLVFCKQCVEQSAQPVVFCKQCVEQ